MLGRACCSSLRTLQVSEKILGLDEEVRALRLEAAEAEARAEALARCAQNDPVLQQAPQDVPTLNAQLACAHTMSF